MKVGTAACKAVIVGGRWDAAAGGRVCFWRLSSISISCPCAAPAAAAKFPRGVFGPFPLAAINRVTVAAAAAAARIVFDGEAVDGSCGMGGGGGGGALAQKPDGRPPPRAYVTMETDVPVGLLLAQQIKQHNSILSSRLCPITTYTPTSSHRHRDVRLPDTPSPPRPW